MDSVGVLVWRLDGGRFLWLGRAADPFFEGLSIWTGVKDALRAPASPAPSRSWTPDQIEKDLAGYRGGGPGVATAHSPTEGDRSTPTPDRGSPRGRKVSSIRQPHPGLAISETNENSFASPTRLPSWSPGGKKILSTGRPDRPSSQSPPNPNLRTKPLPPTR